MPRGYRRSGSSGRRSRYARSVALRSKYSVETSVSTKMLTATGEDAFRVENNDLLGQSLVVASTGIQGMRKVKHMQVTVALRHAYNQTASVTADQVSGMAAGSPIMWAMVYAPAGSPAQLQAPNLTGSLYEPNQFVICSGIADPDAGPIRINTPLARNLNSGDAIYLVIRIVNGVLLRAMDPSSALITMARYAITLN